jgi:hypothetical protein
VASTFARAFSTGIFRASIPAAQFVAKKISDRSFIRSNRFDIDQPAGKRKQSMQQKSNSRWSLVASRWSLAFVAGRQILCNTIGGRLAKNSELTNGERPTTNDQRPTTND